MITLDECVAMCGLTPEELDAIREHEHIPEIAAAALADYLLHQEKGVAALRDMIRDDIRAALGRGDRARAAALHLTLHGFLSGHKF